MDDADGVNDVIEDTKGHERLLGSSAGRLGPASPTRSAASVTSACVSSLSPSSVRSCFARPRFVAGGAEGARQRWSRAETPGAARRRENRTRRRSVRRPVPIPLSGDPRSDSDVRLRRPDPGPASGPGVRSPAPGFGNGFGRRIPGSRIPGFGNGPGFGTGLGPGPC